MKVGPWITEKIPLALSRKIAERAKKHDKSTNHLFANEKIKQAKNDNQDATVVDQIHGQFNIQNDLCFLSYFLFSSEISHTTNWATLISTAAGIVHSGKLKSVLNRMQSYMSTTTVTDFLSAIN